MRNTKMINKYSILTKVCIVSALLIWGLTFAVTAKIETMIGVVKVQKAGTGQWIRGKVNMPLNLSDKIRTELGSEARILFSNGTSLKVEENTVISLKSLTTDQTPGNTTVKVWNGAVMAKVNKLSKTSAQFQFETPTVIAGVRGTVVKFEAKNNQGSVFSFSGNKPGSLGVYPPGKKNNQKDLEPGMKVVGGNDGTMTFTKVNKEEEKSFERFNQENEAEDPKLEIKVLKAIKVSKAAEIHINGKSEIDNEIKIKIIEDGKEREIHSEVLDKIEFNLKIPVEKKEGDSFKIRIEAYNMANKHVSFEKVLDISVTPMELNLVSPNADAVELSENILLVSGSSLPGSVVKVLLDDAELASGETDDEGKFSISLNLGEMRTEELKSGNKKKHKLTILVTEIIEGEQKRSLTVEKILQFRKATIPYNLESPAGDMVIKAPKVEVKGTTKPGAIINILMGETALDPLEADGDGKFSATLNFDGYENKVVKVSFIIEVDGEKEKIVRSIEYKIDFGIKGITILNEVKNPPYITENEIEMEGEFSPPFAVFNINGEAINSEGGKFKHTLVLENGEQFITAELIFKEQKQVEKLSVFIDTLPPDVLEIIPNEPKAIEKGVPEKSLSPMIPIKIKTSPDAAKIYINKQEGYPSGEGLFEGTVLYLRPFPGKVKVIAVAEDLAGNVSAPKEIEIIVDPVPGEIVPLRNTLSFNGQAIFSAKKNSLMTVSINGAVLISDQENSTGIFQIDLLNDLSLMEQPAKVNITISGVDEFKREMTSWANTFIFDSKKPDLVNIDGSIFGRSYKISFDASEECIATFKFNTGEIISTVRTDSLGHGEIIQSLQTFIEHNNAYNDTIIVLELEDKAGNKASYNLNDRLIFDFPPPPPRQ